MLSAIGLSQKITSDVNFTVSVDVPIDQIPGDAFLNNCSLE